MWNRYRIAEDGSQKQDFSRMEDGEPIRVEARPELDYEDMAAYIRSWPDKLVSFVSGRLADDDMEPFVRELYEYICEGDRDGPAYEAWRDT